MLKNQKYVSKKIIIMMIIMVATIVGYPLVIEAIGSGNGTIEPIYKPEWEKVSSSINIVTNPDGSIKSEASTIEVTVKGTAVIENPTINDNVSTNYSSQVTGDLRREDIVVYVDNEIASNITKNVERIVPSDSPKGDEVQYKITLSGFEEAARVGTKPYKDWSGNIKLKILGRGEDPSTYTANTLLDDYGNQSMMELDDATGTWIDVTYSDGATNTNTNGTMYTDFITPEFTYKYANTTIGDGNHGDTKIVKVVFDVTDKYFKETSLASNSNGSLITVKVDDDNVNSSITKSLRKVEDINYTIDGTSTKVGERYELAITGLEQKDANGYSTGFSYSGPMTLAFDSGLIKDHSNNTNNATTITIGIDETDGNNTNDGTGDSGSAETVDVVDPVWKVQNLTKTTVDGITTASMDLIAVDKYFKESTLEKDDIEIWIEGVNIAETDAEGNLTIAPELQRTLTEPTYIKWNNTTGTYTETTQAEANGVKYTFTASNFEESDELFFETREDGTRVYREYSGQVTVVVPADKAEDNSGNKSLRFPIDIGTIDTLKPEVIKVSSTANKNATNVELSTHTIVFDIVDKYLNTSAITAADTSKIHVYLDNEEATTVTKTITDIEPLSATINGSSRTVGYRYTLVLSNFEKPRTTINYDREFTDWSGKLTIKIDAGTATDTNGLSNDETTLAGNEINTSNLAQADFVDYVKPDATYEFLESDIEYSDANGKSFTMKFDITDKYYSSSVDLTNLQILMSAENETGEGQDGYIDLTTNEHVQKSLTSVDIKNVVNGTEKVIGKRYTLVLTNLEQVQKVEGNQYLDYSGSVTLIIPSGIVKDTSNNVNDRTSITSGINLPGGDIDDLKEVDVVAPLWERTEYTTDIHNKTATIKLLGTDKYFYEHDDETTTADDGYGTLTTNEIKYFVDGVETTGNIGLSTVVKKYEDRIVAGEYGDGDVDANPTTETVQYGVEYTISISNLVTTAKQVKIQLVEGSLVDESGNKSRTTEFMVYNTLISAATETEATSKFLGETIEAGKTTIQRQDIHQVVFLNSAAGSRAAGLQNVWDVSAQQDGSILAWYEGTSAPYTVYIGSDSDIYGNVDSSYLFSYIGYSESSTATETVRNLSLLHTENVTSMRGMFFYFGYRKLETLNLGAFDTTNVTRMDSMFSRCGNENLKTLNLGTKFDTSNVIFMNGMFYQCGNLNLVTLEVGEKFDTSKVTNMSYMFVEMGESNFETLDLGTKFDTSNVTNMEYMFGFVSPHGFKELDLSQYNFDTSKVTNMSSMFAGCGNNSMTSFNLGDKFDTSNVTTMSHMFASFGYNLLTLDLGDKFYTTKVTNMTNMFKGCSPNKMTTLDLGPAFTKIAETNTDMFTETGKSGAVIFAPESIYSDRNHFKLDTNSATTIEWTRGTINPVYKPKWKKVSSELKIATNGDGSTNLAGSTIEVVIKGNANETFTNGTYTGTYASDIKSLITAGNDASNLLLVKIDGEIDGDADKDGVLESGETPSIRKTVQVVSESATEVKYKITLSGFEETARQSGKNFKEWSGNIAIQPVKGTLVDKFGSYIGASGPVTAVHQDASGNYIGNKNMIAIDDSSGNWLDIEIRDAKQDASTGAWIDDSETEDVLEMEDNNTDASTNGIMFTDYIRPEFTYEYNDTIIGSGTSGDKKVKVVFDVTDKYFASTTLSDLDSSRITVKVDEDQMDETLNITKTLTKTAIFVMNKQTKAITSKGTTYELQDGEQKVGERYELLVEGLQTSNGIGYSGPMTLDFPAETITDLSGNTSVAKTITIGIDDPTADEDDTKHEDHNTQQIVDVVNPLWTGLHNVNTIERADIDGDGVEEDTVTITIIGSDKYYATDIFAEGMANGTLDAKLFKISVYVDDVKKTAIQKSMTAITDATELATLAANAGLPSNVELVGYKLTLSNFGDEPTDISGITKIVIAAGSITDDSNNKNLETTIYVGNQAWEEDNEPLESGDEGYPRYPAFRNDIVDFIDPVVTYEYSTVVGAENPNVDYEEKEVTVKFKVSDKYLLASDLINNDNTVKNISILVDNEDVSDKVNTNITADSTDLTDGEVEYTLVVSNIQQTPNNAFDFSGPMQLVFNTGAIEDTSGNVNATTTITLDTEIGPDIVDVVDPIIYYNGSTINRNNNTVTLYLKAEDKYLSSQTLATAESTVKIKVIEADGTITHEEGTIAFENGEITHTDKGVVTSSTGKVLVDDATTITKDITLSEMQSQSYYFDVVISDFGIYEGITSVIIPEGLIKDTSGNGNIETEILVGRADDTTAFKHSLVDFTKPTWQYVTSTINRDFDDVDGRRLENGETVEHEVVDEDDGSISIVEQIAEDGTVTLQVKGTDTYFDESYYTDASKQLNLSQVKVYVNDVENTNITKTFATGTYKEYINDELDANGRLLEGVKYTIILGNFDTNEGTVRIEIPADAIRDTSKNKNDLKSIDVGNEEWVESNEPLDPTDDEYPKYQGFKTDIVDFIKPIVKYQYEDGVNPVIDRTDGGQISISFTVTDTNFLESNLQFSGAQKDIRIFVDVEGNEKEVTNVLNGVLTSEDFNIEDANGEITDRGLKYTLTLSDFEQDALLLDEVFIRHSGVIKLVVAEDKIYDSSGNPNNETTIIVDYDDGSGELNGVLDEGEDKNGNDQLDTGEDATGIIVDFIKPKVTYNGKYLNWLKRYAEVTIRVTDRFYDTSTTLEPTDITLYEQNSDGNYVQINDFDGKIEITRTPLYDVDNNLVGYDYKIKLKEFEEEFKLRISIPADKMGDTSGNFNDQKNIDVSLDNKKPTWEYISADGSKFVSDGEITFNVKGVDKYLDLANSNLTNTDLKVVKDGVDVTNKVSIAVEYDETNSDDTERSKAYKIVVTGITQENLGIDPVGTYSLIFAKDTLVDEFVNKSAATTISFSKSAIDPNTSNYVNVTYHVTPDLENVHKSYVHELMSVNTTGTNFENTKYRPSTIGELNTDGENMLFGEPMYEPAYEDDGYTIRHDYSPKSFAGWLEVYEDGKPVYYTDDTLTTVSETETLYTKIYGLYDDIPNTVTNLKVVWENATVIFVSSEGSNSNSGTLPTEPVEDIMTAYSKLDPSGTATNNIIVIMDEVEWDSNTTLTGNATITSLYGGMDYTEINGAALKISSNMVVNGDIIFDNIEIYSNSNSVSDGSEYVGKATYSNMLISNYSGNITLGRKVTTPSDKYTFGAIIGGNYKNEATGNFGTHTIRIEAGRYNNIIAGSTLASSTETSKFASYEVVIGNMKDAAISKNDKLTITGYVALGENEKASYPNGSIGADNAYNKDYADVTLYSGTFTGDNAFNKAEEDIAIYLRSINGSSDGILAFEMYGGVVNANLYGGARNGTEYTTNVYNTMNFYGGNITGNIFGQGATDTFRGSSTIILRGCFEMTGNVFGGSNATAEGTGNGTGNTDISIHTSSATVNGNIYGGSNGVSNSGYITGKTTITINAGNVGSIYGSGNNSGNTAETAIAMVNGVVTGNIVGGAYNAQGGSTVTITILGGTITGNVVGGNENTSITQLENDTKSQDVNIVIGDTSETKKPRINGKIYGSGDFDQVGDLNIELFENQNVTTVFGGASKKFVAGNVNIYLKGMTVNELYGGGEVSGTVGFVKIFLNSGTADNVYGGGIGTDVTGKTTIEQEGTATVDTIFGGSSYSGTAKETNITLKSGTLTTAVYGGGDSAPVGTSYVTLDGMNVLLMHGGSKELGLTTSANVILKSGTATEVFGGGLNVGATTTNITHKNGATIKTIYGGNNATALGIGGVTGTANIEIKDSVVENVFGGNWRNGTTTKTVINIHGNSAIKEQLYGGGYKSNIGTESQTGSTTINITGGTISCDIFGGSESGRVYGTTNINIGKDAVGIGSLTGANIYIRGNIYGAGLTGSNNYTNIGVQGNTNILMDNSSSSPIAFKGSIYGAGKGCTYSTSGTNTDMSTVILKDFGTSAAAAHQLYSIERTGKVIIGNSFIEFLGKQNVNNADKTASYSLNRVTNELTIYDNTTLYTRRAFNMVGGFNSYTTYNFDTGYGTRATVEISDEGVATTSSNNRLYTFEGVNIIFAKREGDIYEYANAVDNIWGEINGMAFFGMYRISRDTGAKEFDIYDANYTGGAQEEFFANGTFVEGKHKTGHDITKDGFYTNIADYTDPDDILVMAQIMDVLDGGNYYDWIVGAEIVDYSATLIASAYGKQSMTELVLDYEYVPNATYTLNRVSLNALNTDVNLINPLDVPLVSEDANNTFGLTIETDTSGWLNKGETNIYTANKGSFEGDSLYKTDNTSEPGKIKFRIYNSINITEQIDLGNVNLRLTGKTPATAEGTPGNIFIVIISLSLRTEVDGQWDTYEPRFTDHIDTELHYTSDSKVDLTYTLYKQIAETPYLSGMYRVLTTTTPFPAGTRITLNDRVREMAYYYYVEGTETEYRLADFLVMDSTNDHYSDSDSYFNSTDGYVLERYDVSIDFLDTETVGNIEQETYLELRYSDDSIKYDNGDTVIKYTLYNGKNAIMTETISNQGQIYSVVDDVEIQFVLNISIKEQTTENGDTIMDTKFYDKSSGLMIEILDSSNGRVALPEAQNLQITNVDDLTETYVADEGGVIRIPMFGTLSSTTKKYKMTISQNNVAPGRCSVNLYFFSSDDGLHRGNDVHVKKEFYAIFVNKSQGAVGIEATGESRIISKATGLNLEGRTGIDMQVSVTGATNNTNLRVELYKRNTTYTSLTDESTYTGTSYTQLDLKEYLDGTWRTPEEVDPPDVNIEGEIIDEGLITEGSYQYILLGRQNYATEPGLITLDFEKAFTDKIDTGEYKLVVKSYYNNILTQTVRKTFIVTQ